MSLYPNDILDSRSTTSPLICFSYPSYSLQPPSRILQHRVHFLQVQGSQYISYGYNGYWVQSKFLTGTGAQGTFLTGTRVKEYISYRYRGHRVYFLHVQGSQSTFLTGTRVTEYIFQRYRGHRLHFLQVQGSKSLFLTGTGVKKYLFYRYILGLIQSTYLLSTHVIENIQKSTILYIYLFLAHPQSSLAFHWPRIDMEQQLSIKLLDISGKFKQLDWSIKFQLLNTSSKTKILDVSLKFIFTKRKLNIMFKHCVKRILF